MKQFIIRFGFCDVQNDQGWGKCYQPQPSARLITLTSTLIIPDITKTSSNNCLQTHACPIAYKRVPHMITRAGVRVDKKWVIHVKLKSWLIYWLLGPTVPYLKINLANKRLPYFVAIPSGTDCQTTSSPPFFLRDSRARVKSPHARKGDTRRGERNMRDYRRSPSFWISLWNLPLASSCFSLYSDCMSDLLGTV